MHSYRGVATGGPAGARSPCSSKVRGLALPPGSPDVEDVMSFVNYFSVAQNGSKSFLFLFSFCKIQ